jgi:hypothetical protein
VCGTRDGVGGAADHDGRGAATRVGTHCDCIDVHVANECVYRRFRISAQSEDSRGNSVANTTRLRFHEDELLQLLEHALFVKAGFENIHEHDFTARIDDV